MWTGLLVTLFITANAAPSALMEQAHAAYGAASYERAAQLYQRAAKQVAQPSGQLLYNLGTARLANGELGAAIAAFRRARALRPRDARIGANLAMARRRIQDELAPPEPTTVSQVLAFWHHALSASELMLLVLASHAGLWTALALRRVWPRTRGTTGTALLCAGLMAIFGVSWTFKTLWNKQVAVVTTDEAKARATTTATGVVRFTVHEGAELTLLELEADWARVALPERAQGWLPRTAVAVVPF